MKKYALITGASAGIGKEFAYQLAQQQWNLVLIARRLESLKQISEELIQKFNVEVCFLSSDLSDPAQADIIYKYCQSKGIQVSMLINNAGYGLPGDFDKNPWQDHQHFLNVMLTSVVQLTHLFYPEMKKNQFGRIINIASLAGLVPPTAGHTLYGATKSFLIKFSHSLHLEALGTGVHVTALCPGFTYTEFHDVNGTRPMVSQLPKIMWMKSADVVKQGLIAVERNQAVKINGKINRLLAALSSALPDWVMRGLLHSKTKQYRKR
jgi:short-subunit dehydrogenase